MEWRVLDDSNGLYEVSSEGQVRSVVIRGVSGKPRGKELRCNTNRKGYKWFRIEFLDGNNKRQYLHRVVALAFLGPCPEGMQVNHRDGNKLNNAVENLEYVTCGENIRHGWANGLYNADHCRGESNNRAVLTEQDVRDIRAVYPSMSLRQLAGKYNVSKYNIWSIVKRKTWAHVN